LLITVADSDHVLPAFLSPSVILFTQNKEWGEEGVLGPHLGYRLGFNQQKKSRANESNNVLVEF